MPAVITPCGGGSSGGSADLPSALITQIVNPYASTVFSLASVSMSAASFQTNDATVFGVDSSGGITTIKALTTGTFTAWATVRGELTSPPAAGSYLQVFGTSTSRDVFDESRWGDWRDTDGFGDYEAGATNGWVCIPAALPQFFFLRAGQNSGSNIQLHAQLWVVRTSLTVLA